MTAIGVFSGFDGSTVHLIADTLGSTPNRSFTQPVTKTTLSTRLVLDLDDQKSWTFSENTLKIGILQENIAIGFSGLVKSGNAAFKLLIEQIEAKGPFSSFGDFEYFIKRSVLPSSTQNGEPLVLCGFYLDNNKSIKFCFQSTCESEKTEASRKNFFCGSGKSIISQTVGDLYIPNIPNTSTITPEDEFSVVARIFILLKCLETKGGFYANLPEGEFVVYTVKTAKYIGKNHTHT